MPRVLIVDDEPNIRRMLSSLLEAEGHSARVAEDGAAALLALETEEPDVVLLDLALPGADGLTVLHTIRERWPDLPVVMMSGRATLSDAVRATRIGAFHFLEKPLAPEALLLALTGAFELRRARALSRTLTAELAGSNIMVGSSPAMQSIRELIERIGPTDARVLITGESGSGKELAAVALHAASGRSAQPFVRVNCAAIPRDLVESEMFGHERGSFTGASETRRGRFELADGGTLLMDEVADLGPEAQAKLLRAIESGTIERLGSEKPIQVDVRVLAATNRDLDAEMESGGFRRDLFFRLNVLHLHMPPLRERLDDVPELVFHFLTQLRARHGLATPRLTGDAMARLRAYAWPGNVRELANVCERVAILHAGREVTPRQVEGLLRGASSTPSIDDLPLSERLDAFERESIARALREAEGNVSKAANQLGTDRPNLYRRMRRLDIDR